MGKINGTYATRKKALKSAKSLRQDEFHDLIITRRDVVGNSDGDLPLRITMLCAASQNSDQDLLFIDQVPIPRDAWSYDNHDKVLRWIGLFGGGQIHLYHTGRGGTGVIGKVGQEISVSASAKAQFLCSAALNCGAKYVTQGSAVVGLSWDTTSTEWNSADWINDKLLITYTVTQGSSIEPPSFTFEFEDKETEAIPWDPTSGSFQASLKLGKQKEKMVWNLVFKSTIPPPDDQGPSTGPDSVYPYWLQAVEDAAASSINGVIEIDDVAPKGTLVGIKGERAEVSNIGYYQVSADKAPFAVFDGKINVNGIPIGESFLKGKTLIWKNINKEHQEKLGLPAEGSLEFNKNGSIAYNQKSSLTVRRLNASSAINAIKVHNNCHPNIHNTVLAQTDALADSSPTIQGLLAMTPFGQNSQGEWGDIVQTSVREDLLEIMNSFVPSDIWKLLFPNTNQPTLSGELAIVANSPVSGVNDPTEWYKKLGTAVMTQGMSNGSDENCKNMNGPRAAEWLKQEVANSKVYAAHAQLLFQYHWAQLYPSISDYLTDQINNAASYESVIDAKMNSSIEDIDKNVINDASSPEDIKQKLKDEVTAVAQYAKTNKLFWAFAYYTYNTAPAMLANIAIQMGINTGSSDGTTLSRLFQQNITVLTSLDPSGYFAQQYNQTINIFMATNILPSMYGFIGDENTFSLVKEYMEAFVEQNINNEDKQIADAAAQIKDILDQQGSDEMLKDSIEALRSFAAAMQDTLSLPYVSNKWLNWFCKKYPSLSKMGNVFGSVLISGLATMAIYNLILDYKSWDQLSDAERTEVILNSIQLGLQVLSAVVKRAVRIYAIFSVEGMSFWQRAGSVSRIIFVDGEANQLNEGLLKISDSSAKWLGDTAGAAEMRQDIAMLMNIGENDIEEISWTTRIFGKNMDEFIATRLGPLLVLAGIGLTIYFISTGETGVKLASDIINIVSGALTLFSMVGGWLIEGGIIAADGIMAGIIAVAGPLAIVAAFVGIGLMLYEMFKKQPDPIEDFVNDYVKPAGFYVSSKCSSIDYVVAYAAKDQGNLMMLGFTLTSSGKVLTCNSDGLISLGNGSALPDCVWQVQTDGLGMSQIVTIAQKDPNKGPAGLLLSLLSDNTISFQPKMKSSNSTNDVPTVVTQTWLSIPKSKAVTTNDDTALVSLDIAFQPVKPDNDGNYQPSQAYGWLISTSTGVSYTTSEVGSTFNLKMSGMAPNFMHMSNLEFVINTIPSQQQTFGPSYGINPSTPLKFTLAEVLPNFLNFDKDTGVFQPNGQSAGTQCTINNNISVSNSLGAGNASFTINVAPA